MVRLTNIIIIVLAFSCLSAEANSSDSQPYSAISTLISDTPSVVLSSDASFTLQLESISSFGDILWHSANKNAFNLRIKVPHYSNSLTFSVIPDPFVSTQKYTYSFRLIGDESEFSPWSISGNRTYYHLEPGFYSLLVKARNTAGIEATTDLIEIRVLPPLYRQWPAILLYFLGSILIFAFVFKLKHLRKKEQKKQLETEIKIRTNLLMEQARELKNEKEKYIQANTIKTRLLRFAAHDLRNPITAIMGYSKMLETEDDNAKKTEYATVIHDISQKMYTIVQNMLASGARDEDSLSLDFEHVDVKEILFKIKQQYLFFLKEKKQSLDIQLGEKDLNILADKVRISEVLENLLSNAIKFSPPQSTITIQAKETIDHKTRNKVISISVSDMGPGFSDHDKELAFREFQTLSAKPTSSESSTGLGLFIVKQLVAAHDGRIFIRSNPNGSGTTISILLPSSKFSDSSPTTVAETVKM